MSELFWNPPLGMCYDPSLYCCLTLSMLFSHADLAFGSILLFNNLGPAAVFGLLIPILLVPPSQYLVRVVSQTQKDLSRASDARVAIANEVLASIKHTKLMAYEAAYAAKILKARRKELEFLRKNQIAACWLDVMSAVGPAFTLFVSLLWYTKVQHRTLTAAVAFSSLMVTQQLSRALTVGILLLPLATPANDSAHIEHVRLPWSSDKGAQQHAKNG